LQLVVIPRAHVSAVAIIKLLNHDMTSQSGLNWRPILKILFKESQWIRYIDSTLNKVVNGDNRLKHDTATGFKN
jgi:hypothetical protein